MNYFVLIFHLMISIILIMQIEAKWHPFYHMLNILLPKGKPKRAVFDYSLALIKILLRKGPKSFWFKFASFKRFMQINVLKRKILHLKKWRGEKLVFPKIENPEVSIMVLTYNNSGYLCNCLKSILENTRGSYEIIVIDNASADNTQELLKRMENIQIIRHAKNYGYVDGYNKSCKKAKGKYLVFLNDDIIVTKNWLPPLIETIKRKNVGAVGGKLIFPHGKLQEAGGIISKEVLSQNYGRDDDPDKPEYNFVREVDYCTSAAILVRKDLFEKIGGFDRRFKPIYCNEVDLSFSLRNLSYKTLYQPDSAIIHFESTAMNAVNSKKRILMEGNREKFFKKWSKVLEKEKQEADCDKNLSLSEKIFLGRDRRKTKILVIDSSDNLSNEKYSFLKSLSEKNQITFSHPSLLKPEYTKILQRLGIEVIYRPYETWINDYLQSKGRFFDIIALDSPSLMPLIKKYCKKARITRLAGMNGYYKL